MGFTGDAADCSGSADDPGVVDQVFISADGALE